LALDKTDDASAPLQCITTALPANPIFWDMSLHVSGMALSGVVIKTISAPGVISHGILLKWSEWTIFATRLADEMLLLANPTALYPARVKKMARAVPTLPHPTMANEGFILFSLLADGA
jgi:hypothetical protein